MAIIIVALAYFSSISAAPKKVCRTRICVDYANELLNDMNTKIKPCDNFYEYVCGNWGKNHPIPGYRTWHSQSILMSDGIKKRLLEMLKPDGIDSENPFVIKAKELYKDCMDTSMIKKNAIRKIMNYVEETGGWPIIMSKWEKNKKPWQTVDSEYNVIMGISPFIKFTVEPSANEFHINYLVVRPYFSSGDSSSNVSIMKSDDDLFRDPAIIKNMKWIKKIVRVIASEQKFGLNKEQVNEDAQGIARFVNYLKSIAGSPGSNRKHFPTIEKFQKFSDSSPSIPPERRIDWLQRIKQLFTRKSSDSINRSTKIVVHRENYFKGLSSIPDNIEDRDIVNTIQWWFVKQTLTYTNPEMLGIRDDPKPRWMKCIKDNELQYALAYIQVKKDVLEDTKPKVVNIVQEMKIAMKKGINESDWLDEYSKSAAMGKVDSMTTLVGYPDWYKDPTMLSNELYQNLLRGSSYLENVLLAKQFEFQQKLESHGKSIDGWSTVRSIINNNAYQDNKANSIVVPAGILQEPLFNADYPHAINYGRIGTYISHEMSHPFDNEGILYDKEGFKINLWSNVTIIQEYQKRCQCFIDQFNKYGVSGDRTLNENIADSTGLRTAFEAYNAQATKNDRHLPGLKDFSSHQLFFISFARSHCTYLGPNYKANKDKSKHSPSPKRVNGAVSNSKDFSKTFNCPKNSLMNLEKKCGIWY